MQSYNIQIPSTATMSTNLTTLHMHSIHDTLISITDSYNAQGQPLRIIMDILNHAFTDLKITYDYPHIFIKGVSPAQTQDVIKYLETSDFVQMVAEKRYDTSRVLTCPPTGTNVLDMSARHGAAQSA